MFCHQKIAFRNFVIVLLFQVVICTLQFIGYRRQRSRLSSYLDSTSLGVFNKHISRIVKEVESHPSPSSDRENNLDTTFELGNFDMPEIKL